MKREDYTARGYQQLIGQHILAYDRCAVWAGMGMGKTVSTLTALDACMMAGESHPTLILAPLRVARSTWPDEARKWNHLRNTTIMPIVGSEKERRAALRYDAALYTTNYDNLPWLIEHWGERWPYRTVVIDEATKVKSFRLKQGGKRAQSLARVAHTKVKRLIELTGKPAPNGLADLWGQMWFVDAGQRLGRTFTAFRERWFQKSFDGYGISPLPNAQAEIEARLRDVCITIDPADWFDLEKPIATPKYVDLPPKARELYRDMERKMFMELDGVEIEAFSAAARTIKCLQLANGAAYIDDRQNWREVHDEKLQVLEEVVEEANGAPVLCAYHFKSDVERIKKAFPDAKLLADDAEMKAFKTGKYRLGVGHPQSIGHGIDGLQEVCNIVCFFGHWWDADTRAQFIERVGPVRQLQAGKKRPVFIYDIVARDTIDEEVILRVDNKVSVQELLLQAMKKRG